MGIHPHDHIPFRKLYSQVKSGSDIASSVVTQDYIWIPLTQLFNNLNRPVDRVPIYAYHLQITSYPFL